MTMPPIPPTTDGHLLKTTTGRRLALTLACCAFMGVCRLGAFVAENFDTGRGTLEPSYAPEITAYSLALDSTAASLALFPHGIAPDQRGFIRPAGAPWSAVVTGPAIAAGYRHSLALRADGSVQAWGLNGSGQTDVPTAAQSEVVAVAAGRDHSLALKTDGTVIGWGLNSAGQTEAPSSAQGHVIAIAAGGWQSLALLTDGSVQSWGNTAQPPLRYDFVAIAAGENHALALDDTGAVAAWGSTPPAPVEASTDIVAIAAADYRSLALKRDGSIVIWGSGPDQLLTVPTAAGKAVAIAATRDHNLILRADGSVFVWGPGDPALLSLPDSGNIATIAGGDNHALAIRRDGSLVTWGNLGSGLDTPPRPALQALALPVNAARPVPYGVGSTALRFMAIESGDPVTVPVESLRNRRLSASAINNRAAAITTEGLATTWGDSSALPSPTPADLVAISTGFAHTVAINTAGDLVAWGSNAYGQLNAPADATNLIAVSAAGGHTLALRADGRVLVWGNSGTHHPEAIPSRARSGVVAIAAGYNFNLALCSDGSVVYWGDPNKFAADLPPEVSSDIVAIAVSHADALALKSDGTPIAWGGSLDEIPVNATGLVAIAMGGNHALGLRDDGQVVAWGANSVGQTDVPLSAQSGVVAIAAGQVTSYALKADGTLISWGEFSHHPESDLSLPDLSTPVIMTPAPSAPIQRVPLTTGPDFSVALDTAGTPFVWGYVHSQLQPPANLNGLVAIAAGDNYVLALTDEGGVIGWGDPPPPLLAIPTSANDVVAIAAGPLHALALNRNGSVIAWGANGSGALNVPDLNPDPEASHQHVFTAIAATENVSLGLRSDGRVIAWGSSPYGEGEVPTEAQSGVVAIAGGRHHALALKLDGTVVAWGANRLGEASGVQSGSPVVAMTAGEDYSAFLRADGTVLIQGLLYFGEPFPPELQGNIVAMAGGRDRLTLLTADGLLGVIGGNPGLPPSINVLRPGPPGEELTLATTRAYPPPTLADLTLSTGPLSPAFTPQNNLYAQTVPANTAGLTLAPIPSTPGATLQLRLNGAPWQRLLTGPTLSSGTGGYAFFGVNALGDFVSSPSLDPHQLPSGIETGLIGIGVSDNSIIALKADGSVVSWYPGSTMLQSVPLEVQSDVTAIASGGYRVLALKTDGSVVSWYPNSTSTDFLPPETQADVVRIAAKENTYLALRNDGSAIGWGDLPPAPPEADSGVVAIAAGNGFAFIVKTDGSVVPWGTPPTALATLPAELQADVVAIQLGQNHALALKTDGTVIGWGELHGETFTVPEAARIDAVVISIVEPFNAVQKADGSVVTWDGYGPTQQHAVHLARPQTAPLPLRAGANRVTLRVTPIGPPLPDAPVATGYERHLLALDGAVISTRTSINSFSPSLPHEAGENVVSVYSGHHGEYALKADGSLLRLSGASLPYEAQPSQPGELPARAPIATVSVGYLHSLLLRTDGTTFAWGSNLPDEARTDINAIAAGEYHALALRRDGSLVCWEGSGNLLPAPDFTDIVAIAAMGDRNLALRASGEVVAWSAYDTNDSELLIEARSGVVGIAMNKEHQFAIKADGSVVDWRLPFANPEDQTPPPAASSGVVSITTARDHQIALKSDGSLVTWGRSSMGTLIPLTSPAPLLAAPVQEYHFIITHAAPSLVLVAGDDTAPENHLPDTTGLHDFGLQRLGNPATQSFTLLNAGTADLVISTATVDNPSAFSPSGLTLPVTLAPGEHTSFNVLFEPEALGVQSTALILGTNQPNAETHQITLSGDSVHLVSELITWRHNQFDSADLVDPELEATIWGDHADPDGDGLANLLEYALALLPLDGRSTGPGFVLTETADGPRLQLTFTRLKRAAVAGLTYQVEWSETLESDSWSSANIEESMVSSDTETETINASIPAAAQRRFLRLRVIYP